MKTNHYPWNRSNNFMKIVQSWKTSRRPSVENEKHWQVHLQYAWRSPSKEGDLILELWNLKKKCHYKCIQRFECFLFEGICKASPVFAGMPKSGVPSLFQVNFCARGERFLPQPWLGAELAWYKIQSSVPSGDLKNELWPGAYTPFSIDAVKTGKGFFVHDVESNKSLLEFADNIPRQ